MLQVRSTALAFLKRMYEKDHLRDYIEKFALNYLQLLVHPNPPSLLFGADKDTGQRPSPTRHSAGSGYVCRGTNV